MDVVTLGAALKGAKSYTDSAIAPLMGGVHYKGSVLYFSDLPSNPEEGDGYTVKYAGTSGTVLDGTEYVWGYDNDVSAYAWIDFGKDCYTKAQTDAMITPINSKISGIAETGTNYIELSNGVRVYFSDTEPTGTIPEGSIGIGF